MSLYAVTLIHLTQLGRRSVLSLFTFLLIVLEAFGGLLILFLGVPFAYLKIGSFLFLQILLLWFSVEVLRSF